MRGRDRHGRTIPLDQVFANQKARVRGMLITGTHHLRDRLAQLNEDIQFERIGTYGGKPAMMHAHDDADEAPHTWPVR